jgi:hypothetical protein
MHEDPLQAARIKLAALLREFPAAQHAKDEANADTRSDLATIQHRNRKNAEHGAIATGIDETRDLIRHLEDGGAPPELAFAP